MLTLGLAQRIAVWAIPVVFAITLHEVAHGFVALKLGDPTAKMLGRLTLNPIKHIDPIGTIIVPLIMILLPGGFIFGWAKPVPVSVRNLPNPRRDMAIVGAAGPIANLSMAILWALVIRFGFFIYPSVPAIGEPVALAGVAGVFINVLLMFFNLIPLPPLDGGRVAAGLMPREWANVYERIEPFGFWILLGLLFIGAFRFLWIPMGISLGFFASLAGITPGYLLQLLSVLLR